MEGVTRADGTVQTLPLYQCHKRVRACQIARLEYDDNTGRYTLVPVEPYLDPFTLPASYVSKHKPTVGGYFVQYRDGYMSFSPIKEFEDGYTAIDHMVQQREDLMQQLAKVNAAIEAAKEGKRA